VSYLAGNVPGTPEQWELQEGQFMSRIIAELSPRARLAALLSVGVVTAVEISNRISINVLLPDMQGSVGANSDQISWAITLYNLGFLCSIAVASWMTRVIGTRKHLLYSIGFYSIGAFGCFLSGHSLTWLLVSRTIMGFGGGAFLVRAVILANTMFPGKSRMGAVTKLYGILGLFQVVYPPSMGWINDHFHWNYAFLIDFPFLAIGAMLIAHHIPKGRIFLRDPQKTVDYRGAFVLLTSLACLQLATSRGEQDLWLESKWIAASLFIAIAFLAYFLWWDSRKEVSDPVFHLRVIWRTVQLRSSLLTVMIVGAILGAGLYVVPQYLRFVQDYSATQTGGFVSIYSAGLGVGLVASLHLVMPKIGGAWTTALGLTMLSVTCGLIIYVWTPTTPTAVLAPALFLQGLFLAPTLLGAANVSTGNVPIADVNDVSTMFFFVRQIGNTIGVTAATVLFDYRMTFHSSRLLDTANRLDPITRTTLSTYAGIIHRNAGGDTNPVLGALQLFENNVIIQSRLLSYIDIYFGLAFIAAVGVILLWFGRLRAQEISTASRVHFHHLP
jgi:MFS transporter, DHA2 family, multidrug resistance protein